MVPLHFRVRGKLAKRGVGTGKILVLKAFMIAESFANGSRSWQSAQSILLSLGGPWTPSRDGGEGGQGSKNPYFYSGLWP
jgi:hypothetical protein